MTRRAVSAFFAVGAIGMAFAPPASSKQATAAHGTFSFSSDYMATLTKSRSAELSQFTYKGALVGTCVDAGSVSVKPSGAFSGRGTEYCAAVTLDGKAGAFSATYSYSGSGNTYRGMLTFVRGFGKLAGLKGGGRFSGDVKANSNTYDYSYSVG